MHRIVAILAALVLVLFVACKQETKVEQTATVTETVATVAPASTEGTVVETAPTISAPETTETTTTVAPVPATTKPSAKPTTPASATTTTQAPVEAAAPAPAPVVEKPATPPPAPVPETKPATKPATRTPSTKAPKTHTVNRDGALHPANTDNPTQKCGMCHGKDLKGGKAAPSCYSCHETPKW